MYSVKPDLHDEVTRVRGSLARTLKSIETLHSRGFYVEVATPLMTANFDQRFEIEAYFESRCRD